MLTDPLTAITTDVQTLRYAISAFLSTTSAFLAYRTSVGSLTLYRRWKNGGVDPQQVYTMGPTVEVLRKALIEGNAPLVQRLDEFLERTKKLHGQMSEFLMVEKIKEKYRNQVDLRDMIADTVESVLAKKATETDGK